MSIRHRVRWTPEAVSDVEAIVDWFNDPVNAGKVIAQLTDKADALAMFPARGRTVPELQRIGVTQYFEVQARPWRMLYAIRGHDVWIMAVVDGRRRLEDLLFERLVRPFASD